MKKKSLVIFCLFFAGIISAQDLRYEAEVLEQYFQKYQKKSVVIDISGICDAVTINTDQGILPGWDGCAGTVYEGTVEFELTSTEYLYDVFTISENGNKFNDQSFGAYYACYGSDSQGSLPNSDAYFPTLFFEVTEQGEIKFTGSSQWGEVYSISDVSMDGSMLYFQWTNDYGEGAAVELARQDGQLWEELLAPTPVCTICSESDSLALVALYNSTNGAEWHIPWDLTTPVRNWYGVTLNDDCCVAEIDMGFSSELNALGVNNNNLVGELPDEMGDLTSLEILDMGGNMISGEALSKIINNTELKEIYLFNNQISGNIPTGIETLQELEVFSMSVNELTGQIPSEFANLEKLRILSCSRNQLMGELPSELSNISTLEILFASANQLSGEIPTEYSDFENLRQLSAWGNSFIGTLPEDLGDIPTLENITLDYNHLSGEIPLNLNTLRRLRLSYNQLEGTIPNGLTNTSNLRLNNNNFTGEIPDDFATEVLFGYPIEVNLSHNNFTGQIRGDLFANGLVDQAMYFNNNNFESCLDSLGNICLNDFNEEIDTVEINGIQYYTQFGAGYNLTNNPKLAWEGNIQNACNGKEQIGAPCNDGNPDTENDGIDEDCNCSANSVATEEISQIESLSINPNPVSSGDDFYVNIDLNESIDINLQIIDITGKTVHNEFIIANQGNNEINIDSHSLNSGMYFLKLSSEKGVTTKKFVIQ